MPTPEQWRQIELENAAALTVARPPSAAGRFLKLVVPIGAVMLAGYIIYAGTQDPRPSFIRPDNEEFRTTQFPAPSLGEPPPQRAQGTIVIPPAPPPPPPEMPPAPVAPPVVLAPPPPPEPPALIAAQRNLPPPDDSEARRLAEEERRRWERFRANSIVVDQGGEVALAPGGPIPGPNGEPLAREQESDANRRFLRETAAAGVETAQASQNRRIDALVPQGTMIRAVLENAVVSDLPGMVRAVTTEDVWSFDGRRILIPSGTRLIGDYRSAIARGQTRLFIVWTRMLRSDGVSVQLGSPGTDDLGRTGNAGYVDNKYVERFGAAIVLSVVGAASQFLAGLGVRDTNTNGATVTVTDPVTGITTTTQPGGGGLTQTDRARQIAAQSASQTLTQLAQDALRESINIPPTIHLDQGTRVIVFVRRDLDFSGLYPDPVRDALREIQRERQRAR
jgi:type IV secretion system protein VirB10